MMTTHQKKHVLITCYDDRNDQLIEQFIQGIRNKGDILEPKSVLRPPGGIHTFLAKPECRQAFYELLTAFHNIAHIDVFHLFPHTNCQYCGLHLQEKIGNGTQSDLRFHVKSAQKMLAGLKEHFGPLGAQAPRLDVQIILTTDQRIVTIDQALTLLPHIPAERGHGSHCCADIHPAHQSGFSSHI
jgi:hypothetical protein